MGYRGNPWMINPPTWIECKFGHYLFNSDLLGKAESPKLKCLQRNSGEVINKKETFYTVLRMYIHSATMKYSIEVP